MKISIYIAISANGLISNARNVPDWLSPEYGTGFASICERTKAVIMGKRTYNILAPDFLPLTTEGTTVVLTTDDTAVSANETILFTNESPSNILQLLSERGHTEAVIIGGSMVISAFMNEGIVNDVYLVMEPKLFGAGLPMLTGIEKEFSLRLLEVKQLNNNTVQLHYKIEKSDPNDAK